MAGSIADFKSSFSTELARPNRFDVNIPVPLGLVPYRGTSRMLTMRCENAELPGRTIATTTAKIYGVDEKFPYMTSYNDMSLTFIVSDDMKEKKFFDAWLNWINPNTNFNVKYKQDFSVALRINQYDVQNQLTYSVDLVDAFPIAVNQMDLNWASDGYHKVTVTFAYTSWRDNSVETLAMDYLESAIASSITGAVVPTSLEMLSTDALEMLSTDAQNAIDTGGIMV
jgi:hypothetical protein